MKTKWKDWIPVFTGMTEKGNYGLFTRRSILIAMMNKEG